MLLHFVAEMRCETHVRLPPVPLNTRSEAGPQQDPRGLLSSELATKYDRTRYVQQIGVLVSMTKLRAMHRLQTRVSESTHTHLETYNATLSFPAIISSARMLVVDCCQDILEARSR